MFVLHGPRPALKQHRNQQDKKPSKKNAWTPKRHRKPPLQQRPELAKFHTERLVDSYHTVCIHAEQKQEEVAPSWQDAARTASALSALSTNYKTCSAAQTAPVHAEAQDSLRTRYGNTATRAECMPYQRHAQWQRERQWQWCSPLVPKGLRGVQGQLHRCTASMA